MERQSLSGAVRGSVMGDPYSRRYDGLQVLRGIAVLLVIWTHLKHVADFSGIAWIDNYAGNVGVDVFFVISGFVISMSARSLDFAPRPFLINRFARVAPLFWLTSLPLIALALARDAGAHWKGAATTFTFLPLFDVGAFTPPTNNFGWTLSFEFWFYLAFGLMLALYGKHAWKGLMGGFALGTGLVWLFYTGSYYLPTFLFGPMIYEFLAGMLIYRLLPWIGLRTALLAACAALAFGLHILSGQAMFGDYMGDYAAGFQRVFFWGGFGVSLVLMFVGLDNACTIRWPRWALLLGDCSYSIYLLQAYALWAAINLGRSLALPAWAAGVAFVALCLGLGIAVSRAIEFRATRAFRRYLNARFGRSEPAFRPGFGAAEVPPTAILNDGSTRR